MADNPLLIISILIYLIPTFSQVVRFFSKWIISIFARILHLQNKEKVYEFSQEERRTIVELATDINLINHNTILVTAVIIIAMQANFLALIAMTISPVVSWWLILIFYWSSSIALKKLRIIQRARELYIEDKAINAGIASDFDETAYLLKSSNNVAKLKEAIEECKAGHTVVINFENRG